MFKLSKVSNKPFLYSITFLTLSIAIILITFLVFTKLDRQRYDSRVSRRALEQAKRIEQTLLSKVHFAQALTSFIEHSSDNITYADFNDFVESLLQYDEGVIASMAYSPGLKVKMIWPNNKVNELATNKDLSSKPGRASFLRTCIDQRKAYIEGPTKFAHLDSALCLFTPLPYGQMVVRDSTADTLDRNAPYSVADVTIRWDKFLEITGLNSVNNFIKVALKGVNGTGQQGSVFYGDATLFSNNSAVIVPIDLPMGEWIMAASAAEAFVPAYPPYILSALLACVVTFMSFYWFKNNKQDVYMTEQRYHHLFKNSHDIMWVVDFNTLRYKYVSDNCTQLTGYTPQEYSKLTLHQTCTEETLSKALEKIDIAIKDAKSGKTKTIEASFEIQLYSKVGTRTWTQTFASAATDATGEVVELIGIFHDISEQKKLEIAFCESERRYQLMANNSSDCVWILDAKTMICNFVSASTSTVTGYLPEDMLGKRIAAFMPSDSYIALDKMFSEEYKTFTADDKYNFEMQVYRKTGSSVWVNVSANVILDADGALHEIVLSAHSIDKQKKVETELAELEKKFLAITANTRDYIWIQNVKNLHFSYISSGSDYVCGYQPEEMKTFTNKDLYPQECAKLLAETLSIKARQFKLGEINKLQAVIELQQYHKNGSLVWVEVSTFARTDERKNPIEYLGITRNINDRKTLEIALKESETKYRVITENTRDIIWAADLQTWQYIYVNSAIFNFTELTQAEFLNLTLQDTTPASTFNYIVDITERLLEQYEYGKIKEPKTTIEAQIYNKHKELLWAEMSLNIIKHDSDKFNQVIAVVRVIEDRKKMEFAMQEKQKELSVANATKDKFFSIIAHDLKNPLFSLLQLSDLLETDFQKRNDIALNEEIQMMKDTLNNTHKLLQNLLEWSRSNMGSIVYTPSKHNIIKITNDCFDYLKIQSLAKSITINLETDFITMQDEYVCNVHCDEHMIHTVMRNLLSNAIKFSFKNSSITVALSEYSEDSSQYIRVSVKDAGTGISPEDMNKLFRIDEKIVSSKGTNDESGTGLGLILCKEFIDKHNSAIWAESEFGKGTTFYFTVPRWHLD